MNRLVKSGLLSEVNCGSNFSYVLNDELMFSSTDYKILQSNENGPFVKCMKLMLNGRIQFFYITSGLRPFSSMISQMGEETFLLTVANIVYSISKVKSNGFLKTENLDLSMEHIYIDEVTQNVYLLYLPLIKGFFGDGNTAENDFRSAIIRMIQESGTASSKMMHLCENLQNAAISIENVCDSLADEISDQTRSDKLPESAKLRLTSIDIEGCALSVDKDSYILGRSENHADGVINDDKKLVGRAHCRVRKVEDEFWIEDLGSANGTYVNKKKVTSGKKVKLQNGDILRLANVELKAQIE